MHINIKIIGATENSVVGSSPVPVAGLVGIALGPNHPKTILREGFQLMLEREQKSLNVAICGVGKTKGETARLYFLLQQSSKLVVPCEHVQLNLSDINLPVQVTINEILRKLVPNQKFISWDMLVPSKRGRPFKEFTSLSITITNRGTTNSLRHQTHRPQSK